MLRQSDGRNGSGTEHTLFIFSCFIVDDDDDLSNGWMECGRGIRSNRLCELNKRPKRDSTTERNIIVWWRPTMRKKESNKFYLCSGRRFTGHLHSSVSFRTFAFERISWMPLSFSQNRSRFDHRVTMIYWSSTEVVTLSWLWLTAIKIRKTGFMHPERRR